MISEQIETLGEFTLICSSQITRIAQLYWSNIVASLLENKTDNHQ